MHSLGSSKPAFLPRQAGWPIAYRPSGLDGLKTPVLMLHGLESHSGWFTQSAAHIARLGHPVYAMDRRGSGASEAPRGAFINLMDFLTDIEVLAHHAMSVHQTSKFHLLGHCFGAIPVTAFACTRRDLLKSLILATPAIYTKAEPPMGEDLKILWSAITHSKLQIPVSLNVEWFTDQQEYMQFIENDPLTLKTASARLYWEIRRARKFIHANEQKLTMPLVTAIAGKDRICDNRKDQLFFDRVPSKNKELFCYPDAVHILEFSSEKEAFFSDLADWLDRYETTKT